MRKEVGGTPTEQQKAYEVRSPVSFALSIVRSGVPLQIWWSTEDEIVTDQQHQSGTLFRLLRHLDPHAPISAYIGRWPHSTEMKAGQLLPIVLHELGLLESSGKALPHSVLHLPAPTPDV
jgi:hypothetical protein